MSPEIEKLQADFQDKVIHGKCQPQYIIGVPQIEMLFSHIGKLTVLLADLEQAATAADGHPTPRLRSSIERARKALTE